MYREKSKKHATTQQLYDTLKKKILMSRVETAASDNVAQALKSMSNSASPDTFNVDRFGRSTAQDVTIPRQTQSNHIPINENGVEQLHRHQRNGSGSQHSADAAAMPPPDRLPDRYPMRRSRLSPPVNQADCHRKCLFCYTSSSHSSARCISYRRCTISDPHEYFSPFFALRQSTSSWIGTTPSFTRRFQCAS